jgi:hypothetical protein
MAVALPTTPSPAAAQPRLLDWGADQVPSLGGPAQRLSRMGNRFAVDYDMPPMEYEEAMAWIQRLLRGKTERVLIEFFQPGFDPGNPGSPKVATAAAGGTSLALKDLSSSYRLKEGQFLSIVHSGRRYLHSIDADVTASGGTATVAITPMLRTAISVNDTVEIATPMIEGTLSGDETGWTVNTAHHVGLSFTVTEAA